MHGRRVALVAVCLLIATVGGASADEGAAVYMPHVVGPASTPAEGGRLQPDDLTYLGAFRLPGTTHVLDNVGWEWGGTALTYYPGGDPLGGGDGYPGSLFGLGHDQTEYVSEVSIPAPALSAGKRPDDLPVAVTLQPFEDIRDGLYDGVIDEYAILRAGLAYLPAQTGQASAKLYFCWAAHAPGNDTDAGPTHGWRDLDLDSSTSEGLWRVGGYPKYVTADYMFDIPTDWADNFVAGRRLATGRFRDGGQAAEGPSLLAIAPWQDGLPPANDATIGATPLLLYQNVLDEDPAALEDYHHSDEWEGGAWLTAGERAAVVFVGTKGTGACWYGCADGTVWPDEPPYPPKCAERGWWSTGFEGQMLFYRSGRSGRRGAGDRRAMGAAALRCARPRSRSLWRDRHAAKAARRRGGLRPRAGAAVPHGAAGRRRQTDRARMAGGVGVAATRPVGL